MDEKMMGSSLKKALKSLFKKMPYWVKVLLKSDKYKPYLDYYEIGGLPPGHYSSPIASIYEIKLKEEKIFNVFPETIPGINLNEEEQLHLLNKFKEYYDTQPFEAHKQEGLRYFFENPWFSYSDGIFLHCMLRHTKPRKIIEAGSGFSSAVMLDTNELFFDNAISCTFIDPYPERILSLIRESDNDKHEIIPKRIQDVEFSKFSDLSTGDILFIDSSHVSKIDSDLNYILFEILPSLNKGVYIHFHDIIYPFEYPKEWIYSGEALNEAYVLRAFLQYNTAFKIVLINTFLQHFYKDKFVNDMPLCMIKAAGQGVGGSIWIQKI
jgi:hypothetical protein